MDHIVKGFVKSKARAALKATKEAAPTVVKTAPKPKPKPKKAPVSLQQEQLDIQTDNRQKVETAARNGKVFVPDSQGERLIKRQEEIGKVGIGMDKAKESIDDIRLSNPGKTTSQLKEESPQFKTSLRVLEDGQAAMSSIESNVIPFTPDDPKAFPRGLKAAKEMKAKDLAIRGARGQTELHHMLPKGMSAAFFNRMDSFIEKGLASPKDLVEMAELAKSMKLRTGDASSNIKVMPKDPHNELHTAMQRKPAKGDPAEIAKQELEKILRKVKSPKELKKAWKEWLETDGRYLKDTAEIWEDLDLLIKEIQST